MSCAVALLSALCACFLGVAALAAASFIEFRGSSRLGPRGLTSSALLLLVATGVQSSGLLWFTTVGGQVLEGRMTLTGVHYLWTAVTSLLLLVVAQVSKVALPAGTGFAPLRTVLSLVFLCGGLACMWWSVIRIVIPLQFDWATDLMTAPFSAAAGLTAVLIARGAVYVYGHRKGGAADIPDVGAATETEPSGPGTAQVPPARDISIYQRPLH